MRRRHLPLLLLPPLAGCVAAPVPPIHPAARHAALVLAADQQLSLLLDHLAARERVELDEAASLRFAATGSVPRLPPPPVTPLAGAVLDPGMDLIVLAAERLVAAAQGAAAQEGPAGADALARLDAALAGLRGAPGRWPAEAARRRGRDAFRRLAEPPPAGMDAARLAADRQAAVEDAVGLLKAVLGTDARSGLRGVLADRHEAWREAQRAMLAAAGRLPDPAMRMEAWNRARAALAADPPDVPAAEAVALLGALPGAHAAAGAGDAAGLAGLEAALARVQAVLAQAR